MRKTSAGIPFPSPSFFFAVLFFFSFPFLRMFRLERRKAKQPRAISCFQGTGPSPFFFLPPFPPLHVSFVATQRRLPLSKEGQYGSPFFFFFFSPSFFFFSSFFFPFRRAGLHQVSDAKYEVGVKYEPSYFFFFPFSSPSLSFLPFSSSLHSHEHNIYL